MIIPIIIGLLIGFVLQRSKFCITSAFRDIYLFNNIKLFLIILIIISIQSLGLFTLQEFFSFHVPLIRLSYLGVTIGSFIFGFGMVLASGCLIGSIIKASSGLLSSVFACLTFIITFYIWKFGFLSYYDNYITSITNSYKNIYLNLSLSPWFLVIILLLITCLLVYKQYQKDKKLSVATLKSNKKGIKHILFEKRWDCYFTGIIIGLILLFVWISNYYFFDSEDGLGITSPLIQIVLFFITFDIQYINWGFYLIISIILGCFMTAIFSNEFKFIIPSLKQNILSLLGGCFMGTGAALANGCTVTNALVATSYFSWYGWIAVGMLLLGSWFATFLLYKTKFISRG